MPERIVYIEDNYDDFELMREAFAELDYAVELEWISDGLAGLQFIEAVSDDAMLPALLLIDINLPKVDGVSVLTRAKAHPRMKSVTTVVVTSSLSPVDRERCLAADAFFAKGSRWSDCLLLAQRLIDLVQSRLAN